MNLTGKLSIWAFFYGVFFFLIEDFLIIFSISFLVLFYSHFLLLLGVSFTHFCFFFNQETSHFLQIFKLLTWNCKKECLPIPLVSPICGNMISSHSSFCLFCFLQYVWGGWDFDFTGLSKELDFRFIILSSFDVNVFL